MDAIPQGSFDVTGLLGSAFGAPAFAAPMPTAMPMAQPAMPNVSGLLDAGYQPPAMTRMNVPSSDYIQAGAYTQKARSGGVAPVYLDGIDAVQIGDAKPTDGYRYYSDNDTAYGGLLSDTPVNLSGLFATDLEIPFTTLPDFSGFTNFIMPDFSNIDLSGFTLGALPGI